MDLDVGGIAQCQQLIERIEDKGLMQRQRCVHAERILEPGFDMTGQRRFGEEDDGGTHWKIVN